MDKDTLLSRLVELETQRQQELKDYDETNTQYKEFHEIQKKIQETFDIVKQQLTEAGFNTSNAKGKLDNITYRGKQTKEELDKLKRELARLHQFEVDHEEYLNQIDVLRQRCLDATWRKENRDDGRGALKHQIEGAIHLAVVRQGLLGDKRGLGKTLTNLVWLDLIKAKRVIVLCPSDTMDNYIREIKLWAPHRNPVKIGGWNKGARDFILPQLKTFPQFCLVLNYEAWRKDPQLIDDLIALKADTFVEDEAHRAKTLSTSTCKGVTKIRFGANECTMCGSDDINVKLNSKEDDLPSFKSDKHQCNTCSHTGIITDFTSIKNVMPMTGTPILNKPQELFPQLRMIDVKNFHTLNDYLKDFCRQDYKGRWYWGFGAEKKLTQIIGPRYLARDRKAAGVEVPPCTPVDHSILMKELEENYPKQYAAYKQVREAAQLVLDPDKKIAMSMLYEITVLLRLRQVLTWPAAIKFEIKDPKTEFVIASVNLDVHESAKLDKAEELIKEITEEGERVVLFSQFKEPLKVLNGRLGMDSVVYDGDTSDYLRNKIQMDFDIKTAPEKPKWNTALCNYKAAGEGLNMQAATHLIILDREWNPGKEDQATGRIDRMGQTKETQIHFIDVEKSVDTWMRDLIAMKRDIVSGFEVEADLLQSAYDALRNGEM